MLVRLAWLENVARCDMPERIRAFGELGRNSTPAGGGSGSVYSARAGLNTAGECLDCLLPTFVALWCYELSRGRSSPFYMRLRSTVPTTKIVDSLDGLRNRHVKIGVAKFPRVCTVFWPPAMVLKSDDIGEIREGTPGLFHDDAVVFPGR